ncbi:penicillin-binding protein 2 [bacterium]|nr:penicillin-binding protein 2 [bacterium]
MRSRVIFIEIVFCLLSIAIVFKLYDIQVKKHSFYQVKAKYQTEHSLKKKEGWRGDIFIKRGENLIPLAISKFFPALYLEPNKIRKPREVEERILSLFNDIPKEELERKINKKNDPYELVKKRLSKEEAERIESWHLEGVGVEERVERFYPLKNFASHLVGFVSQNEKGEWQGRYGLEKFYDQELKEGYDLVLTIEKSIQEISEKILRELIEEWQGEGGQIIVAKPKTGEILAMASYPDFDPNQYSKYPLKNFLNPNVESVWEPGSVFKVITMSAGLDSEAIKTETTYNDTGQVILDGKTIRNWNNQANGVQTMTDILAKSLNTGAVFVQRKLGKEKFLEYIKKFNLNKKTGIDLPGEIKGLFSNLEDEGRDIDFATASFGQGIAVTPIEMLIAINAIANDGLILKPFIVKKIISPKGKIKTREKEVEKRAIKKTTALTVKKMMIEAVKHGKIAEIKGYDLAGKTGTAQVAYQGKYLDQYIHSYVGFGPAENPQFIILIKLDKPKKGHLSGITVVPAFKKLAQFMLNYFNLPPKKINNSSPSPSSTAQE